jgi:hypothetical protein
MPVLNEPSTIKLELAPLPVGLTEQRLMFKNLCYRLAPSKNDGATLLATDTLEFNPGLSPRPVPTGVGELYTTLLTLSWGRQEGTIPLTDGICERLISEEEIGTHFRNSLMGALGRRIVRYGSVVKSNGITTCSGTIFRGKKDGVPLGNQLAEAVAFTHFLEKVESDTGLTWDFFGGTVSSDREGLSGKQQTFKVLELFEQLRNYPAGTKILIDNIRADHSLRKLFDYIKTLKVVRPDAVVTPDGEKENSPFLETGFYDWDFKIEHAVSRQLQLLAANRNLLETSRARFVGVKSEQSQAIVTAYNKMTEQTLKETWESIPDRNEADYEEFCSRFTFAFTPEDLFAWVRLEQPEIEAPLTINDVRGFIRQELLYEKGKGIQALRIKDTAAGVKVLSSYEKLIPVSAKDAKLFDNTDFSLSETVWPKTTRMLVALSRQGDTFTRSQVAKLEATLPRGEITVDSFISRYLRVVDPKLVHKCFVAADSYALDIISALLDAVKNYHVEYAELVATPEGREEVKRLFKYNFLPQEHRREASNLLSFSNARVHLLEVILANLLHVRTRITETGTNDREDA